MAGISIRLEAHLWFKNFDQYAARERELLGLLEKLHGEGSVIVFFRATPEYVEIPGACYDPQDGAQVDKLIGFCGKDNVDFVVRTSQDASRQVGCLRGRTNEESDMEDTLLDALNSAAAEVWGGDGYGGTDDGCAEEEDSG